MRRLDVLQNRLDVFISELVDVFKDEHQPPDLFDQFGIFLRQVFQQRLLGRPITDVKDLGDARNASRRRKRLADDGFHAFLKPRLNLLENLWACLAHARNSRDHRNLAFGRKSCNHLCSVGGSEMGQDQRNRLRMFVVDEGQQVLRIDLLQKSKRQRFE